MIAAIREETPADRASHVGFRWERNGCDEHLFVIELARGALQGVSGVVRYAPEFEMV